jgi:hypothetical protein
MSALRELKRRIAALEARTAETDEGSFAWITNEEFQEWLRTLSNAELHRVRRVELDGEDARACIPQPYRDGLRRRRPADHSLARDEITELYPEWLASHSRDDTEDSFREWLRLASESALKGFREHLRAQIARRVEPGA